MDELDLLRSAAPPVAGPSSAALTAARSEMLLAVRTEAPYQVLPVRRALRRSRWAIGAAVVSAAAVALVAVPVLDAGPARPSAPAEAQAFLLRAADTAAAEEALDARSAAFWYVRSQISGTQAYDGEREIWLGREQAGRIVEDGDTSRPIALTGRATFFGLDWQELFALPTETDALREKVYELAADKGPGPDAEAFVVVGDLLRESPAPPALRAALLRVAATIPGVELGARTTDGAGRPVIPVSRPHDGVVHRLLLDPDGGRLLGEDSVSSREIRASEPGRMFPAGTVLFRSTTITAGPVADDRTRLP